MKRYITKDRILTAEERLEDYKRRVREAQEDIAAAVDRLTEVVESGPVTTAHDFFEVNPGDPGYEDAPFMNSLIMDARNTIKTIVSKPSHWIGLVAPGKYPSGLVST